ncbi:MAG: IS66 family transposase [Burkholderiaceae bacterium]
MSPIRGTPERQEEHVHASLEKVLALYPLGPEKMADAVYEILQRSDLLEKRVKELEPLAAQSTLLEKRVKELEVLVARLSKNSGNSSKPPSSDITRPKSQQRAPGKRKIGGQPGHPRHERPGFSLSEITNAYDYRLDACPECGNTEIKFLDDPPRVLQQMEIKEIPVFKEEHRSYPIWCERCQAVHYHPFPAAVVREGLFKERLSALVVYMKAICHASFSTIRKFVSDVLGERVSRGYLRKIIAKASTALGAPYAELLAKLSLEQSLNVDETGHKDNGEKFWTWVFRADLYVLFKIDKSRGAQVLLEVLGEEFDGVIGCDYFSAYRKFMKNFNVTVQFCIAHLIRDVKFLTKLPDAATRAYGARLLAALKALFKVIHGRDELTPPLFQHSLEQAREHILEVALRDVPSRLDGNGKELKREAFNMAKRFRQNGKAYFEFITTPGISPTNNLAEQAVRFVVIDRRITQGTRSEKGRESCERLWTVVGTCAMQGRSVFEFIRTALRAYFRDEPAPSLVPALG